MMKVFKSVFALAISISMIGLASSCGDSSENGVVTPDVPETSGQPRYLARIEVPKMESGNLFIQHSTLEGNDSVMAYCLEYNPSKFHSRWVAFRFDSKTKKKNTKRPDVDPFIDDPTLSNSHKIGERGFGSSYKDITGIAHSGTSFDRGHICASADRLYSVDANAKTFYMSNMSPQISDFNQGFWNAFEMHVQDLAQGPIFSDTLYVVKGGTIADGQTIGYIERSTGAKVTIPKYYYMALLNLRNGNYKALGFYMEHKAYGYKYGSDVPKEKMKDCIVTIDELEKLTGIDFFHNLSDDIENQVEATCDPTAWGF